MSFRRDSTRTHVQIVRRRVSRNRHLFVRSSGMQMIRHRVAGDRSVSVRGQPPVKDQTRTGRSGGVQNGRFGRY